MQYKVTSKCVKNLISSLYKENYFPEAEKIAYSDFSNMSIPMQYSKKIGEYLMHQPIKILEDEQIGVAFKFLFDDSIVNDAYLKGGHTHDVEFFTKHSDYQADQNPICFVDWKHYCVNYQWILKYGFDGTVNEIRKSKNIYASDNEKIVFLDALENMCFEIKKYAENVADAYEAAGYSDIAENLRTVPFYPAKNFHQAVQSVWFCWLLLPDSLGRLDQLLYPFYKKDIENGEIDNETVYNLICELFVKAFLQHDGVKSHRSGDTTLTVGGYISDTEDGFNELSRMMIEALVELPIWRPQMIFRYTKLTSPEVFRYITEMNSKQKNIVFTNDEKRIPAYEKAGVSHQDAINYTMIGCNEWTIMGMGDTGSQGFFNPLKALERLMYRQPNEFTSLTDFDKFYDCYIKYLEKDVDTMMNMADEYHDACCKDINVLSSILIDGCIQKGMSLTSGGAKYNISNWSCNGFANIVDSLSVIRQFVYQENYISLTELSNALIANWRGYEKIRAYIIKNGQFFGNDNKSDEISARFVNSLYKLSKKRVPKKGGCFMFGSYTGYNAANVTMGKMTLASPDGRFGGEQFACAMASGTGKATNGVTAYLSSVAKVDYTKFIGPSAVNLMMNMVPSQKNLDLLSGLYQTFFKLGGLQLQPDYITVSELKDAQEHPENHSNLRVRVTGYSGFFVQFDKDLQDDLIKRTEFCTHG